MLQLAVNEQDRHAIGRGERQATAFPPDASFFLYKKIGTVVEPTRYDCVRDG